ncbi:MAG: acyltransferase [Lysobacteraceae bacterium]|nr:MAG: acyltransferase [Xanthomonadaceae bacterium]
MEMPSNLSGRRLDIDLLRAIAVLAVILFHFDVPGFDGGFIGVDVFFVISGYLISGQIASRIRAGNFSYVVFFARRARRLVPALTATLLLVWVFSLFVLTPDTLNHTLQEIGFAAAYLSNFSYWLESGYFDTAAITKPLLHTWSLSVEEQFYVFWPLLMLFAARSGWKLLLPILGLLSLIACEVMIRLEPSAAFFLFPFRVFEFALGAVIWDLRTPKPSRIVSLFSMVSLGALVASVTLLHERSHFPGFAVLPACLGTAWIIAARPAFMNRHNFMSALGGWVGKVSYSAYLVHWPLVVFYVALFGHEIGWLGFAGLMASTMLLSELMWRFVEQPFLHSKVSVRKFVWGVPISILFALTLFMAGKPLYIQINLARVDLIELVQNLETRQQLIPRLRVLNTDTEPSWPRITVLGDSHAVDASIALRLSATKPAAISLLRTLCDPLTTAFGEEELSRLYENHGNKEATADQCRMLHRNLLHEIQSQNPDILIFSERWRAEALPYLEDTIRTIKANNDDVTVVLFGRQQEFLESPGRLVGRVDSAGELNREAWRRRADHSALSRAVADIAVNTGSIYVDRTRIVCPTPNECDYLVDGQLTYVDVSHWSESGMRLFGKRLFLEIVKRGVL